MQLPQIVEIKGTRVLSSQQLAQWYGTTRQIISNNFTRNKERYIINKHYICLKGQTLSDFKRCHQIDDSMKRISILYLWTEKGALLHAKSLNTDKAWEAYDYLIDHYFRSNEIIRQLSAQQQAAPAQPLLPDKRPPKDMLTEQEQAMSQTVISQMRDRITTLSSLLDIAPKYNEAPEAGKLRYSICAVNMDLLSLGFKLEALAKR